MLNLRGLPHIKQIKKWSRIWELKLWGYNGGIYNPWDLCRSLQISKHAYPPKGCDGYSMCLRFSLMWLLAYNVLIQDV
jgi:hypothetical protein